MGRWIQPSWYATPAWSLGAAVVKPRSASLASRAQTNASKVGSERTQLEVRQIHRPSDTFAQVGDEPGAASHAGGLVAIVTAGVIDPPSGAQTPPT
jgi:hypothetical protein